MLLDFYKWLQNMEDYKRQNNFYILPDYNTDLKNYGNVVALILLWKT